VYSRRTATSHELAPLVDQVSGPEGPIHFEELQNGILYHIHKDRIWAQMMWEDLLSIRARRRIFIPGLIHPAQKTVAAESNCLS
jgi:hypothetical protein